MKQKQDGRVQRKRECFVLVVSDNDVHEALTRSDDTCLLTHHHRMEEGRKHDYVNIDLFLHYLSCYAEFKSLAKCGTWEKCFPLFSVAPPTCVASQAGGELEKDDGKDVVVTVCDRVA